MKLTWLLRLLTSRDWRCQKRKIFFLKIFENLKDDSNNRIKNSGAFSLIKNSNESFDRSCEELASYYHYTPFYRTLEMKNGISRILGKYHLQTYDFLDITIIRKLPVWKSLIKRKGSFLIKVCGEENGEYFSFSYEKDIFF